MTITGKVIDASTGEGLPLASVTVIDQDYASLGAGTASDGNGNYSLTSNDLSNNSNFVAFSYTGYADVLVHPNELGSTVSMTASNKTLADFTVISKKIISKTGGNLWLTVGIATAALGIGFFIAWKIFKKRKH